MAARYCARCLSTFADDGPVCPNLGCSGKRPASGWSVVLGTGDILDRHYEIVRPLAVGGAGLTYLARAIDASGVAAPPDLAVKVLYAQRASGTYLRRLATEFQILQDLDHEHIVSCRGFVQRTGQEPYLVTLFEQGGSLAGYVETHGPLSIAVGVGILRQVLAALDVAHQRGIVHRDLKPDNVLLRENTEPSLVPRIRVTDFGIAKVAGGDFSKVTRSGMFVGTPEYAAPEQFRGEAATPSTDVFAAAGVLHFVLTGAAPFAFKERSDPTGCLEEMVAQLPFRESEGLARLPSERRQAVSRLLAGMTAEAPEQRWTVAQVLKALGELVGDLPTPLGTVEQTEEGARPRDVVEVPRPPVVLAPVATAAPAAPALEATPPASPRVEAKPPSKPVRTLDSDRTPASAARGDGGGWGVLGVGVVGLGALATLGVVAALAASLWWGQAEATTGAPLLGSKDPTDRAMRRTLTTQLEAAAAAFACPPGPARATLDVAPDGAITVVAVDGPTAECVAQGLRGLRFEAADRPFLRARLAFWAGQPTTTR